MNHVLEKMNGPQMWRDRLEKRQRCERAIKLWFAIVALSALLFTLTMAGIR